MLLHRRKLLNELGETTPIAGGSLNYDEVKPQMPDRKELNNLSNTLQKIHIKEFNKKKKYITFN
jgi:hypothetical protein